MSNIKKSYIFRKLDLLEDTPRRTSKRKEVIEMLQDFDFADKHINFNLLQDYSLLDEKMDKLVDLYKENKVRSIIKKPTKSSILKKKIVFQTSGIHETKRSVKPSQSVLPLLKKNNESEYNDKLNFKIVKSYPSIVKDPAALSIRSFNSNKSVSNNNNTLVISNKQDGEYKNKSNSLIFTQELNLTNRVNKPFNDIVSMHVIKEYEEQKREDPVIPGLEQKKKIYFVDDQKYVEINKKKFYYKTIRKFLSDNSDNDLRTDYMDSLFRYLNINTYLKYIERFHDNTNDQTIINNMTKYLRETYNIKIPKMNELMFLKKTFFETIKPETLTTQSNCPTSPKRVCNTKFSSSKYSGLKTKSLDNYNNNLNTMSAHQSNLSRINSNLSTETINKKDILLRRCETNLDENKKLFSSNLYKFKKHEEKINNTYIKAFSTKDIKLEKEFAKDHMRSMNKQGNFIYGNYGGYFTENQRILSKK